MADRSAIRTRARTRADQDSAKFPTDAQYNLFIDEACRDVYGDLITSGWPPDFSTTTISYNGSSTGQAIGGGAEVFSVLGVWSTVGGQTYELKRLNEGHRAALLSQGAVGSFPAECYDLRVGTSGPVIYFFPRVAGTYLVDYVPDHPGLASDSTVWYGPARSDELVVLSAARKGVLKEGQARHAAAKVLADEYAELLDKVKRMASWFDQRNPAMIRDVSGRRSPLTAFDYSAVGPGDY